MPMDKQTSLLYFIVYLVLPLRKATKSLYVWFINKHDDEKLTHRAKHSKNEFN